MQTVYYILRDNGDGSQSAEWYKGSQFTSEQLYAAADNDKYDSYASGDGTQLTELTFPDGFDIDTIGGITWCNTMPGHDWDADE